ncbi:MAG TPA: thioredoxin-disulfide reductase [Ktedonobacterales bacterium]|nr:thioredoxin-disulfide reductase [Ktedonobacterales bacterium]
MSDTTETTTTDAGQHTNVYDVAIIGSGPAGYTAAIYAARANLRTLVVQGEQSGGQLMITTDVENYPGFAEGVQGPDLMETFETQARRFGAELIVRNVERVDFSAQPFTLWTDDAEYHANAVIVATGASAKWLGLPNEQRLQARGVSGCATCDGFFFKGKELAVVGGGDTAMEEALFLTKFASHVHLLHRRDSFRASKIMQERVRQHPKITIHLNTAVEDVLGEERVEGVLLRDVVNGARVALPVQGFFVAIGHQPNTSLFQGVLETDAVGYLITHHHTMTNIPGVFAAGDVADARYRQAVTAAGDGCRAAIDAERWLESKGEVDTEVVRDPREWGELRDTAGQPATAQATGVGANV